MRKIKQIVILLTGLVLLVSYNVYEINNQETIEQSIIGSWVSNEDSNWEIEFDGSFRKDFYENLLTETYQYTISSTCDSETLSENQYFLKSIDDADGFEYCLIIEAVNNDDSGILSFTSDRGELLTFSKK